MQGAVPDKHCEAPEGDQLPREATDLVEHARKQRAEPKIIELLEKMPDRDDDNMADVMKGVGEVD